MKLLKSIIFVVMFIFLGFSITVIPLQMKVAEAFEVDYVNLAYVTNEKNVQSMFDPKSVSFKGSEFETARITTLYSSVWSSKKSVVKIPKGEIFTADEKLNGFYKTTYGGKTGWILISHSKDHIPGPKAEVFGTKKVETTRETMLYSSVMSSKKNVVRIPKGEFITTDTKHNGFYKAFYGGKSGWVIVSHTKDHVPGPAPLVESFKAKQFEAHQNTTLYSDVSFSKKSILKVPRGAVFSSINKHNGFYKTTYKGQTGWILITHSKDHVPPPKPADFISKADSIELVTGPTFEYESRKIFEHKPENGMDFITSYMVEASMPLKNDYLFVIGEYDSNKMSSMTFVMSRYNKHKSVQPKGMEALELGLSGFFGTGTPETAELTKLVKDNMVYSKDKLIDISIAGKKGYLVVTSSSIEVIFDYDGSLPEIGL
ncbi:hypothetical protein JMA_28750 [Jeotgalibacillus malaysiensis]|uniref:SH3b domain-containing protein n=1 Tax=Jeotgalibacillus malaysiensis TaxID=1508404 RepID=A0A0B5ATZ3_9BACL|nr:hypothetical protein [Jeotgalibacillus malaysiensis]AJD92192.1 hypothetical protein JMA_28750 [Jeotgalibacillus malaysiensis]